MEGLQTDLTSKDKEHLDLKEKYKDLQGQKHSINMQIITQTDEIKALSNKVLGQEKDILKFETEIESNEI